MMRTEKQTYIFQQDWTGKGERGIRDFLLIPAIFFGAVSPGLFLASMIHGYVPGYWVALILNFIGYGITHLLYLGRMERFWRALLNVRNSWISRGFLFNALFSIFGLFHAAIASGIALPASGMVKALALLSAVLFTAYPGFMLQTVKAIPFWRSMIEPVLFFLQGLMGGVAIELLMAHVLPLPAGAAAMLVRLDLFLVLAVALLVTAALILKTLHGGAEKVSAAFLTKGEMSALFLGGAIGAGLVLPLLLLGGGVALGLGFEEHRLYYSVAMILQLVGIYLGKYGILRAGAYSPLLVGGGRR